MIHGDHIFKNFAWVSEEMPESFSFTMVPFKPEWTSERFSMEAFHECTIIFFVAVKIKVSRFIVECEMPSGGLFSSYWVFQQAAA